MSIGVFYFKTTDSKQGHLRIGNLQQLTGKEAGAIRNEVMDFANTTFEKIYIDAKDVKDADLSGINELIHSNYQLAGTNKKIVLIYRKESVVEKWVQTTGLDRFMETALLPAQ
ncbi:MAG TPA: hypothetical protein VFV46_06295 [Lacibacter sp.]|nr:hypothetical protein [Lacibacter sp.]